MYYKKKLTILTNPRYIYGIYIITSVVTALSKYSRGEYAINNFLIFINVFFNTLKKRNLYLPYPDEYLDINHYGIFFSFIIAPFAILPTLPGLILWNISNTLILIIAVSKMPFSEYKKSLFLWVCLQEFITASLHQQFNIALTGLIILSAATIYKKKEVQSTLAICVGFFVKIYGIVGLSSFIFVHNKKKFIVSFLFISLIFLLIPMLYSTMNFGLKSYLDWFLELKSKNLQNQKLGNMQDISLMGFFRRIFVNPNIPNWLFLSFGIPLFLLPYLRRSQYQYLGFKLLILASSLLFIVLFSSSSEPPTYILAVAGAAIWFLVQEYKSPFVIFLLIFLLIFTCFSTSDLFPRSIRENFIQKYSIKALPCMIIWVRIIWELLTKNFTMKLSY